MNSHMVFGFFALYVALVSLYLVFCGYQDTILALLRNIWGRTRGHSLYFLANVAFPLLICVLFLGLGVSQYDSELVLQQNELRLELNVDFYRDLKLLVQKEQASEALGVLYGA